MLRYLVELLGVAVFAVSGVLAAGQKGLDLVGVVVIAVVTAIGGGTLRDLLLDRHPIFWIADPTYLFVILAATAVTLVYVRFRIPAATALLVADGLGLAFFTVGGVQIAEQQGHSGIIAVVMGTITGVVGGVLRDILSNEIPLILRRGHLYATAAIAGACGYLTGERLGLDRAAAAWSGMAIVAVIRFGSILWGVKLPVLHLGETGSRRQGG